MRFMRSIACKDSNANERELLGVLRRGACRRSRDLGGTMLLGFALDYWSRGRLIQ